jgi:hypothetical protein
MATIITFALRFDAQTKSVIVDALSDKLRAAEQQLVATGEYSEENVGYLNFLNQVKNGVLYTQPEETEIKDPTPTTEVVDGLS